ncbi:hypothetical protein [Halalkaliarchaeum desulfuricum]|uniref:hypothetical protein n=1 Tax=Halalkaliarchaeum desulfuricum TaxID=2055893 RepID=UPI001FE8AD4B|nr:hypothetical protein [Halalkaliarchaeum desulfuricum]
MIAIDAGVEHGDRDALSGDVVVFPRFLGRNYVPRVVELDLVFRVVVNPFDRVVVAELFEGSFRTGFVD